MSTKLIIVIVLIAFFVGALGSITFDRLVIPRLSLLPHLSWLGKFSSTSPIIVTRREEVVLNEGANLIDLSKQISNSTVSFFEKQANPFFLGNGIIMTSDGIIFTSKSVIGNRNEILVVLNDGTKYVGLVRALDPKQDLAVVSIPAKNLNVVSFAEGLKLKAGQRILTIGESYKEFSRSFSAGFVINASDNATANPGRTFSTEVLEDTFETDALTNSGRFLGSPIINLDGKLVGMVAGTGVQKIIVAENLEPALSSYLSSGKIIRPKMGLVYFRLTKSTAALRGLPQAGALVLKTD
ncbi:MAG TPA: S1C family serine protease, partial [Patescibacteria group bacterium]|nr:S1C family serine protease [Patescibacteria group bacterium]